MTRQIKRKYTSYYLLENDMASMDNRITVVNTNPAVVDTATYVEGKSDAIQATFDSYYNDIISLNAEKDNNAKIALDTLMTDFRDATDVNAEDYDTWYKDLTTEADILSAIHDADVYTAVAYADASTDGSIQNKFEDIVGIAPEELNVLKEIYDAVTLLDNNYVDGLKAAIDSTFEAAQGELLNQVDETGDTLEELAALVKTGLLDAAKVEISAIASTVETSIDDLVDGCYLAADNCENISPEVATTITESFNLVSKVELNAAAYALPKVLNLTLTTDADGILTVPDTVIEDIFVVDVLNFGRARLYDNDILSEYYLVQKTTEVDGVTVPEAGKFVLTNDDGTPLSEKAVDISFFATMVQL